jgi:hypothetical protein
MKIEFTVLTLSKMRVIIDNDREFIITGEATLEPKFWADPYSFPDYLSNDEKKVIISYIEKTSASNRNVPVVFDTSEQTESQQTGKFKNFLLGLFKLTKNNQNRS